MPVKRGDHYHMDRMINGVRHRESLDTTSYEHARELEDKRVAEIRKSSTVARDGALRRRGFVAAADEYFRAKKGTYADSSYYLEKQQSKPLVRFFGDEPMRKINLGRLEAYRAHRLESVKPATVNCEVSLFKRIASRAGVEFGLTPIPVREHVGRAMEQSEKRHLVRVAESRPEWRRAALAIRLALATGMRRKELRRLRWIDVDPIRGTISVRRAKSDGGDRVVPINQVAMAVISELSELRKGTEQRPHDPVFPWKSFRTAWDSVREAAGIHLRFHDLRHQVATELAEAGVPDATILDLMGHVSQKMLRHYSHVRLEAKRAAVVGLG